MKIRLLLSLMLLLPAALPAGAQPAENLGKQFRELDRVIANREVYAARREGQFEEIKYRLAHGSSPPRNVSTITGGCLTSIFRIKSIRPSITPC